MNRIFRQRLEKGDALIGTILSLPATEVAEIMSLAGLDWLFVDMEHTALDFQTVQQILQAVDSRTPCIVRVPSPHEAWFKKCLDMGATGIMVPQVNSAEEAEQAVKACKYPPLGDRSVGISRAHGYGMAFNEYMEIADEVAIIVQIEHIDAVNEIEAIIEVPGVDALFIGPYDLSASLGKTGRFDDPEVKEAISRVQDRALEAHMPLGIFGANVAAVESSVELGYRLIAVGLDALLLSDAARAIVSALRPSKP
jgi:2-dehydro-3-deoxyglucarate aldolase/4-hydroxy-2-oxoheptanedioate aldolase